MERTMYMSVFLHTYRQVSISESKYPERISSNYMFKLNPHQVVKKRI